MRSPPLRRPSSRPKVRCALRPSSIGWVRRRTNAERHTRGGREADEPIDRIRTARFRRRGAGPGRRQQGPREDPSAASDAAHRRARGGRLLPVVPLPHRQPVQDADAGSGGDHLRPGRADHGHDRADDGDAAVQRPVAAPDRAARRRSRSGSTRCAGSTTRSTRWGARSTCSSGTRRSATSWAATRGAGCCSRVRRGPARPTWPRRWPSRRGSRSCSRRAGVPVDVLREDEREDPLVLQASPQARSQGGRRDRVHRGDRRDRRRARRDEREPRRDRPRTRGLVLHGRRRLGHGERAADPDAVVRPAAVRRAVQGADDRVGERVPQAGEADRRDEADRTATSC